jgi:GntR family transcriptional regulator
MLTNKKTVTPPMIGRPKHKTLTDATVSALSDAIQQGKFLSGNQLPPELNLIEMLGVSRTTLREALRTLEEQGSIIRKRGLGTFVSERSIVKDLSKNFGITEMIRGAGLTPGTQSINIRIGKAGKEVAQALEIKEGSRVIKIDRIRTANEKPVVITTDTLPYESFDGQVLKANALRFQSLYQYLFEKMGMHIIHGLATITAVVAGSQMARLLHVQRGTPLLRITQIDFTVNEQPCIYSDEYHLTDSFTFMVNRKGPNSR